MGGGRRPGATVAPSPRAERGVPAGRLPTEDMGVGPTRLGTHRYQTQYAYTTRMHVEYTAEYMQAASASSCATLRSISARSRRRGG